MVNDSPHSNIAMGSANAFSQLPTSEHDQRVLQQRAIALAEDEEAESVVPKAQYLRICLGGHEYYGVPYDCLEDILYADKLTSVPCVPGHIAGVVNYHGTLLTVLDLNLLFRQPHAGDPGQTRIVVVKSSNMTVGLLVDHIDSNDVYAPSMLAAALPSHQVDQRYIKGIHADVVTMLDVGGVLGDSSLLVNR